jgi:polysaccharide export outer membrane protein
VAVLTPTSDPSLLKPPLHDFTLEAGDLIAITVYGQASTLTPPVRIGGDGNVQLPLIGRIRLEGLTIDQAEDEIARRLSDAGMFVDPQVTVSMTETAARFVTVTGEMNMKIPITGPIGLLEALGAAGKFPNTASHLITIIRPGVATPILVDLGNDATRSARANITLLPRDVIIVSRVGVVYVLGAFRSQGAIPLQQNTPLTLLQLAALEGGIGYEGEYKDLRIIRTEGLERKLITVNWKRIRDGLDPDPVLAADDIVYEPTNLVKAAIKGGAINTIFSIVNFILYLRTY